MKVFIDAGFYAGKALDYYAPFIDDSWDVYAFEPNLRLNALQVAEKYPFEVRLVKKAIWVEDGAVEFRLDAREDASRLEAVRTSDQERFTVQAIDFSSFISKFPEDAIIVCSMDIEGAEYPVLRKMLADKTAQRITLLDIEFHDRLLTEEDEASSSALRRALEGEGVLVKLKI